jgi:hypothetical protein
MILSQGSVSKIIQEEDEIEQFHQFLIRKKITIFFFLNNPKCLKEV